MDYEARVRAVEAEGCTRSDAQAVVDAEDLKASRAAKEARPAIVKDEHLEYLDGLRESGDTNMFGAGPYVERAFDMSRAEAKEIVLYWMKSFSERHAE